MLFSPFLAFLQYFSRLGVKAYHFPCSWGMFLQKGRSPLPCYFEVFASSYQCLRPTYSSLSCSTAWLRQAFLSWISGHAGKFSRTLRWVTCSFFHDCLISIWYFDNKRLVITSLLVSRYKSLYTKDTQLKKAYLVILKLLSFNYLFLYLSSVGTFCLWSFSHILLWLIRRQYNVGNSELSWGSFLSFKSHTIWHLLWGHSAAMELESWVSGHRESTDSVFNGSDNTKEPLLLMTH